MNKELKKLIKTGSLTVAVFSIMGWAYIAGCAWFHPNTLTIQLTHLTPWIREDTFGIICFAVGFVSFFVYNYIKEN